MERQCGKDVVFVAKKDDQPVVLKALAILAANGAKTLLVPKLPKKPKKGQVFLTGRNPRKIRPRIPEKVRLSGRNFQKPHLRFPGHLRILGQRVHVREHPWKALEGLEIAVKNMAIGFGALKRPCSPGKNDRVLINFGTREMARKRRPSAA